MFSPCPETRAIVRARVHTRLKSLPQAKDLPYQCLYCFVHNCRGHSALFEFFSSLIAFYNAPHFSKIFTVIFIPLIMSQLSTKHYSTIVRWSTVYHCTQFLLNTSGVIINSPTSFRVLVIFPVDHFVTNALLYENVEKYPPPC